MDVTFTTANPCIGDESAFLRKEDLCGSLQTLACAKASSVAEENVTALVLGADTIVALGSSVLGKPQNESDARSMLTALSGKTHVVYTGVALVCKESGFVYSEYAATTVTFRSLAKEEIESYLACSEWIDKAGAYAIQGNALVFVDRIDGCYYNVVGLPISATIRCFTEYTLRKDAQA